MSDAVESPEELVSKHFADLMEDDDPTWKQCYESLFKIAEQGINRAAPGLSITQKADLQDLAITELCVKLSKVRNAGQLVNLLRRIATNKTIDLIKSYAFKNTHSIQALEEEQDAENQHGVNVPETLVTSQTAGDHLKQTERHAQVIEALDSLSDLCKPMLLDLLVEELPQDVIILKYNSTRYRLDQCKKELKTKLFKIMEVESKEEVFAL